jgi:pyruvate/2-oxoglutarate dehydrogenase complex dihydrolipoamide acyltransferase (E2) component
VSSSRTSPGAAGTAAAGATLVDVTMPQMGVSVAEGTIVAWRVEVGDRIAADETICEISTDKIDTEVPAPVDGVVAEIVVAVDTTVSVGTVLARIAPTGQTPTAQTPTTQTPTTQTPTTQSPTAEAPTTQEEAPTPHSGTAQPGAAQTDTPPTPASQPDASQPPDAPDFGASVRDGGERRAPQPSNGDRAPAGDRRRYSPVVQRIAAEHGLDLSQVRGTGRGGRVRKQDVLAHLESGPVEEAPLHIESPYRPEPAPPRAPAGPVAPGDGAQLSRMRRQIGEHMKRSLDTAAHCTTWIEVDMSRVEAARARLGVTALAFVARACIDALREHPALNAWLEGDRYTSHHDVNLGIAVSLGEDGLIVPVVERAHELSVEGLAARIKDLARRARARELKPDEVRGGTFTITNPGQYGSIMATPIINQPQVAILDFEAVVKRAVVVTDADGNDSIAIRPMTILGLSWDHRALDGALSAQFLASVKRHLEGASL